MPVSGISILYNVALSILSFVLAIRIMSRDVDIGIVSSMLMTGSCCAGTDLCIETVATAC